MTETCLSCDKPASQDRYICQTCVADTRRRLDDISDFTLWADDKRARRGSRLWVGGSIPSAETPLPFDPRVSEVTGPVRNNLVTWARVIEEEVRGLDPIPDDTDEIAAWIGEACEQVAGKQWAGDMVHDIEHDQRRLSALFDNPPDKAYAGSCGSEGECGTCTEPLYVEHDNGVTRPHLDCPRCGARHDTRDRRDALAAGVSDYLGTIAEITPLLKIVLGEAASRATLYRHAEKGRIVARGMRLSMDSMGRIVQTPTFRIGEVREAIAKSKTRAA